MIGPNRFLLEDGKPMHPVIKADIITEGPNMCDIAVRALRNPASKEYSRYDALSQGEQFRCVEANVSPEEWNALPLRRWDIDESEEKIIIEGESS